MKTIFWVKSAIKFQFYVNEWIMEDGEPLPNVTITDPLFLPDDGEQKQPSLGRAESRSDKIF